MTHSTLTSFCTSMQPSRQPSKQPISTRLSPVPEPLLSQVPESIIDCYEALNLMLPGCQQGSPPDPNNTSNSSSSASWQGQPHGTNLENLVYCQHKTWENVPKSRRPLIDRVNVIITHNLKYDLCILPMLPMCFWALQVMRGSVDQMRALCHHLWWSILRLQCLTVRVLIYVFFSLCSFWLCNKRRSRV